MFVSESTARVSASKPSSDWVTSRIDRRSRRSASAPPFRPNSTVGIAVQSAIEPTTEALGVRRVTIQPCAICCIQVPTSETVWPSQ